MRTINTVVYHYDGKSSDIICPNCNKGHALFYKHNYKNIEICIFSCFCEPAFTKENEIISNGVPKDFYTQRFVRFNKRTIFEDTCSINERCPRCNKKISTYYNDYHEIFINKCNNPKCSYYTAMDYKTNETIDIDLNLVEFV